MKKKIPNFPKYEIDTDGNVYSHYYTKTKRNNKMTIEQTEDMNIYTVAVYLTNVGTQTLTKKWIPSTIGDLMVQGSTYPGAVVLLTEFNTYECWCGTKNNTLVLAEHLATKMNKQIKPYGVRTTNGPMIYTFIVEQVND